MKDKKKTARKIAIIVVSCLVVITLLTTALMAFIAVNNVNNAKGSGTSRDESSSANESSSADESIDTSDTDLSDVASDTETLVECERVFFEVESNTDNATEYAVIVGYDKDDNQLWKITTKEYYVAQVSHFAEIGLDADRFYYVESGKVVALDANTGKTLWANDDFEGDGMDCVIGDDAIYLTSYFGPQFFAVSFEGETLCRVETFDEDYYWTGSLTLEDGKIVLFVYGGNDEEAVVEIDIDTFDYVFAEFEMTDTDVYGAYPTDYFGMTFADVKAQYGDGYDLLQGDHGMFFVVYDELPEALLFIDGDINVINQILAGNHTVLDDHYVESVMVFPESSEGSLVEGYDIYADDTYADLISKYPEARIEEDMLNGGYICTVYVSGYQLVYYWSYDYYSNPADYIKIYSEL